MKEVVHLMLTVMMNSCYHLSNIIFHAEFVILWWWNPCNGIPMTIWDHILFVENDIVSFLIAHRLYSDSQNWSCSLQKGFSTSSPFALQCWHSSVAPELVSGDGFVALRNCFGANKLKRMRVSISVFIYCNFSSQTWTVSIFVTLNTIFHQPRPGKQTHPVTAPASSHGKAPKIQIHPLLIAQTQETELRSCSLLQYTWTIIV